MTVAVEGFENLGVGIDGTTSMAETLTLAKETDALGFHIFCFRRDIIPEARW